MVQKIRKEKVLAMEKLKVSDWITFTDISDKNPKQIIKIENGIAYTKTNKCLIEQAIKWIPEPGGWCWFYDNETDVPTLAKLISINKLFDRKETYTVATPSCISELSYNYSRTMSFKHCEPFICELPSNLKDL